ncbi:50S ribosomal protein L9 [Yunchengibacter salinarum]|uniref:50S ribosomal protein L9 n=1 Tax=Yunchengibacter salinarum TaxID=3133399 RepID=UPI0035B6220D
MNIILMERVDNLGQMGDTVTVKDGYARNFLLPQGKALRATDANRAYFEAERERLEAENLKRRQEAEAVADRIRGLKVVLVRAAGDSGQLYGSVASRDIAAAVREQGVTIRRGQVILDKGIKSLGLHAVDIKLHPEVYVTVTINVARSEDEAETQFKTGNVVRGDEPDTPYDEQDAEDGVIEPVDEELLEEIEEATADSADEDEDAANA